MPIIEPIGGAYSMIQCLCGATFCCGDIARRVMSNSPTDYDVYFLKPGEEDPKMLSVNLALLRAANDTCAVRARLPSEFRAMCIYLTNGKSPDIKFESIRSCSRYMNIGSCCVNVSVQDSC